jgi:hypothetical protein
MSRYQKNRAARISYKNATLNVNFCQHLGKILMYLYIVIHQKDSTTYLESTIFHRKF